MGEKDFKKRGGNETEKSNKLRHKARGLEKGII